MSVETEERPVSEPERSQLPPGRKINGVLAVALLALIAIGAYVGTSAGKLAHRAPRATSPRIGVVLLQKDPRPGDSTAPDAAASVAVDIVEKRLLGGGQGNVVPRQVIISKLRMMKRGGVDDATILGAADVLDLDAVVTVSAVDGALRIAKKVGSSDSETAWAGRIDGTQLAGVAAAVPGISASIPMLPSAAAYRAFVEGVDAFDRGNLRDALAPHRRALELDPNFADAAAALVVTLALIRDPSADEKAELADMTAKIAPDVARLSPVLRLSVEGIALRAAFDRAPQGEKHALSEKAFGAFRKLTVEHPEERLGHLFLGKAYTEMLNGPDESLRHLESARRLTPEWFPITEEVVGTWLKKGDRKQASKSLRAYISLVKDDKRALELLEVLDKPSRTEPVR